MLARLFIIEVGIPALFSPVRLTLFQGSITVVLGFFVVYVFCISFTFIYLKHVMNWYQLGTTGLCRP